MTVSLSHLLFLFFPSFFSFSSFSSLSSATRLFRQELSDPKAICNDGTPASFHRDERLECDKFLIYLQGGGACSSADACQHRCEGNQASLCTTDTRESFNPGQTMWSDEVEENPPFHDFCKVYVHYCSSDLWSGEKDSGEETGGFNFHGQAIVEAVVRDLLESSPSLADATQVAFLGTSAGAHGVNRNCDRVADMIHAENPNSDVRCLPDAPADLFPYWVHAEDCDGLENAAADMLFWNSTGDESCAAQAPEGSTQCAAFATFYPEVRTPFMLIASEWDPAVSTCSEGSPNGGDNPFWEAWREGMVELASSILEERPESGAFLANCPYHVSSKHDATWLNMPVPTLESGGQNLEPLAVLIRNWLEGSGPTQGWDDPRVLNPACQDKKV